MSYDPECERLAEFFIPKNYIPDDGVTIDRDWVIPALAQHIQNAVESWLNAYEGGCAMAVRLASETCGVSAGR